MRVFVPLALIGALILLVGCGSGASAPALAPSGETPTTSLSFGTDTPPAITGIGNEPIRLFNFSHAQILDLGYRPYNSGQAYAGSLEGLTAIHRAAILAGDLEWVTLSTGGYEIRVETNLGTFTATGFVGTVELPNGYVVPAPTDLYLFGLDFGGGDPVVPIPGGRGGGGVLPGS